jgi:hypothetical protein
MLELQPVPHLPESLTQVQVLLSRFVSRRIYLEVYLLTSEDEQVGTHS